jgi:hypothetical protein
VSDPTYPSAAPTPPCVCPRLPPPPTPHPTPLPRYALPAQYDQMRRSMSRLWDAQRPVVEAARAELQERLDNDPYLLARVEGVRVEACRKALYRQEAAEPFEQQRAAKGPRGGEGRVGRVFAPAPLVGGTATG